MIKVYDSNERLFNHNGIKILHPLVADITKKDNGDYYVELQDTIESLYSVVVSLSHIVSDVLVVVLSCTSVDVNYAWWDLTCVRVLKVSKVEWRNVAI